MLGAGLHRAVFIHKTDPKLAIKVAHRHLSGKRNRMEWEIWNNAPDHVKQWLVPCISIHENGAYLVCLRGKKTNKVPQNNPFKKIYRDTSSPVNWVIINGKTVLADYANNAMFEMFVK